MFHRLTDHDHRLLDALAGREAPRWCDRGLRLLTHAGGARLTVGLSIILLLIPGTRHLGLVTALANLTSHLLVQALKRTVVRPRPSVGLPGLTALVELTGSLLVPLGARRGSDGGRNGCLPGRARDRHSCHAPRTSRGRFPSVSPGALRHRRGRRPDARCRRRASRPSELIVSHLQLVQLSSPITTRPQSPVPRRSWPGAVPRLPQAQRSGRRSRTRRRRAPGIR